MDDLKDIIYINVFGHEVNGSDILEDFDNCTSDMLQVGEYRSVDEIYSMLISDIRGHKDVSFNYTWYSGSEQKEGCTSYRFLR
ncbi:hypothetical protein H4219_002218 [Mycoemilia scoparia]|uniref:Uncharacterized protein n=1 Tax=Mycoemilia scoparia TaxID=417184 RepID=A0A9W7ZYX1_9FUNG|nr:hypothetical protein H4219_002218 [Mycoemilia scoparia]